MEDYGWIQLHRKLLANPIFDNAELLRLFIYCLLKANHKENEIIWNGELTKIKKGEFVTGRKVIAKDLKQKETTIYKRLKNLEKLGYINIRSNNKFSLLQIVKYSTYQSQELPKGQQSNNGVTTKGQQSNTNNNDNNENNEEQEPIVPKKPLEEPYQKYEECYYQFPKDKQQGKDVTFKEWLFDVTDFETYELFKSAFENLKKQKTGKEDYYPLSNNFFMNWRKYIPETKQKQKGVIYLDKD